MKGYGARRRCDAQPAKHNWSRCWLRGPAGRRQELLELLDRLNPTINELTAAIEQEVEKRSEARRLMTHPGVGPLTALAFVLIIGTAERFRSGKQIARAYFINSASA